MENKLKPSQIHCSQRKYVAEYKWINFSTLSIHQALKKRQYENTNLWRHFKININMNTTWPHSINKHQSNDETDDQGDTLTLLNVCKMGVWYVRFTALDSTFRYFQILCDLKISMIRPCFYEYFLQNIKLAHNLTLCLKN